MKFTKMLFCGLFLIGLSHISTAQYNLGRTLPFSWWHGVDNPEEEGGVGITRRNNIKLNLTPIALGTYSLFYERAVTNKLSAMAGVRISPNLGSNFNKQLSTVFEGVKSTSNVAVDSFVNFGQLKMSNYNFSGEVRWYIGKKGVFKSAYLGAYANTGRSTLAFPFSYTDNGVRKSFTLDGNFNTFGGGFTSGMQFSIADRVTIDIILIAIGLSATDGTMTAGFNPALSQTTRDDIKKTYNDITGDDIFQSYFDTKLDVDPSGSKVTLKTNTLLPAIKSGFCIGFRF